MKSTNTVNADAYVNATRVAIQTRNGGQIAAVPYTDEEFDIALRTGDIPDGSVVLSVARAHVAKRVVAFCLEDLQPVGE